MFKRPEDQAVQGAQEHLEQAEEPGFRVPVSLLGLKAKEFVFYWGRGPGGRKDQARG